MSGRIKKNTYFVSVGQISQMVMAFILIPFATRYLGPEGFGIYALASSIMFFVLLANDLGLNTFVTREVARDTSNAGPYYSNSLTAKLIFILADAVFLALFVKIFNYSEEANSAILIFAIYGILTSFVQLNTGIFRAHERMEFETIVVVFEKLITTGAGIFVLTMGWGVLALCWVFVVGGLISVLLSTSFVHKHFCKVKVAFDFHLGKRLLRSSLPFGISLCLANLYHNVGIILLSALQDAEVVGWFAAGARLLKFVGIIPTILSIAIFPALSREMIQSKDRFADLFTKGFKYICFLAIPLIAGIIIMAEDITKVMFGSEFENSIVVLRILAWAGGLIFFNIFLAGLFNASNNQKKLVIIQIFATILNVLLNLILIPRFAHVGAAISMVATEGVIFVTCIVFAFQRISRLQEFAFVLKAVAATVVMSACSLLLKNFNIFAVVILSTAIYFSALYIFRGFVLEEILLLKKQ
ncbi:MAG: flippase [bacterium]